MTNIYIPWFWNKSDKIFQNYIKDWIIIQKNIKEIDNTKFRNFINKYSKNIENIIEKRMLWKYDITWDILANNKDNLFKWITRNIDLTVKLSIKEIDKINIINTLYWHSQWGLILMNCILEKPKLLEKIENIELLAPVINPEIWKSFHTWKTKTYLHPKYLLVRKQYIESFKNWDTLHNFLEIIKNSNWNWKVKIMIWEEDDIIKKELFDFEMLEKYSFVNIKIIKDWDHYLWFKK